MLLKLSVLFVTWLVIHATPLVFKFNQESQKSVKENFPWDTHNSKSSHVLQKDDTMCGYKHCTVGKPGVLNVHLVAHTHDDVGWLKTVDQYYYGARNDIQNAGVQYILDTVVDELGKNEARRFIYVEIAFFSRWWNEQDDLTQHIVKDLVNKGKLEFILGGWCMNDEASTHYNAIIDQHTLGFQFLLETFGECAIPKIGWQIDPFGHSRTQASLFAQFGFDGLFFGRLDYQDKDKRMKDKTAEMMWLGSDSLGDQSSLFTGVNYNGYSPPAGFCFDEGCRDTPIMVMTSPVHIGPAREGDAASLFTGVLFNGYGPPPALNVLTPIMDDDRLEDYNVDERVKSFVKVAMEQSKNYTTNHIMMTMGSDFQYQNAHQNFKNLDKLIKYVNEKQTEVNVYYSSPSCYLYALNQANQTYTSKSDDFFPYASDPHTFWTGYFTSRPALKGYVRRCNNFLQVCKQLEVLSGVEKVSVLSTNFKVAIFKKAMGVAQHHDAVSGTEKQAVADDYAKRLAIGVDQCQDVINFAYQALIPNSADHKFPQQMYCPNMNISICPTTVANKDFSLILYNPLARPVTYWVQVPVNITGVDVYGPGLKMPLAFAIGIDPFTRTLPMYKNESRAMGTLLFKADLPALGFSTYLVKGQEGGNVEGKVEEDSLDMKVFGKELGPKPEDFSIENEHLMLIYDKADGLLKSITNKDKNITVMVHNELMYYKSFQGNNSKPEFKPSGAYCFRPNGTDPEKISPTVEVDMVLSRLFQQTRTTYGDWANMKHTLFAGEKYLEMEWTVGPIPFKDGIGKEVINKFVTDMKTKNTFYTDSNGREALKRVINYRPTWTLNQTEPVAGNYYPVNSRIVLVDEDKDLQLTVVTDRSHGGSSVKDGEMELMLHRRTLLDDGFGAGEPLNETGYDGRGLIVRGIQRVFFDTMEDSGRLHRDMEERMYMSPHVSVAPLDMTPAEYADKFKMQWSGLKQALPPNVHLLTLESWSEGSYLLRLEHYYAKGQDTEYTKDATVPLKGLFAPFDIASVEELTLGANQVLKDAKRLVWNVQNMGSTKADMSSFVTPVDPTTMAVVLKPMQIRTFKVTVSS